MARTDLKTVVSADMSQFSSTMRRVGVTAGATAGKVSRAMGAAAASVGRLTASAASLATKMAAAGASVAGVASSAALFKGVRLAADLQTTSVAFETMLGSADAAKNVLAELQELGAQTPFEFPELADAGRMLIAFGEDAEDVADTLRRIGDVASGVTAPIGEIAEIYGKARVQQTLFAEDINQLAGRGIPVYREFARVLGVGEDQIKKMASEGKISFEVLEKAFVNLTSQGGMYFGMMEKQSTTFKGVFSTLTDSINMGLATVGKPIMEQLIPHMSTLIQKIEMIDFSAIGQEIGERLPMIISAGEAFIDGAYKGYQIYRMAVDFLGTSLGTIFSPQFWESAGKLVASALLEPVGIFEQALFTVLEGKGLKEAMAGIMAGDSGPIGEVAKQLENQAVTLSRVYTEAFSEIFNRPIESLETALKKFEAVQIAGPPKPKAPEPAQSPSPTYGGPTQDPGEIGPSRDLMGAQVVGPPVDLMSNVGRISQLMRKRAAEESAAGFSGLAERTQMQVDRMGGIGPSSSLSRGRAGSGLVTGGLGEKRRLRTSKDDTEAKKQLSLQEQQTTFLEDIKNTIGKSLSVA